MWSVDLDDVTRAVTTLIEHPGDCADNGHVSDPRAMPHASATLAARAQGARCVADLTQPAADYNPALTRDLIADFVMQIAVNGEVTR